jgi:hypothetical protein
MHRLLVSLSVLSLSVLSLLTAACASRTVRVPHAPPPEVQLKLANLSRVWVAGFVTARTPESRPEFDLNTETVRLVRTQLRRWSSAQVIQVDPLFIETQQRLSDVQYWRGLGEEHGWPLIVTGSLKLLLAPPKIEQRGKRTMYFPLAGRVLEATVVLIDGHSGEVVSTNKLPNRMRYGLGRFSSPLSLYLQMMDQAMPDWFKAITGVSTPVRSDANFR